MPRFASISAASGRSRSARRSSATRRASRWSRRSSPRPFKQVEFDIMYGEGVSKTGELVDLGAKAGVVEKSGAWFSYDSQRLGQGRENAKLFLKQNPEIAEKVEAAIRQNSGIVAERILDPEAGAGEDEADDAAEA